MTAPYPASSNVASDAATVGVQAPDLRKRVRCVLGDLVVFMPVVLHNC
jgi:hypothetical protein